MNTRPLHWWSARDLARVAEACAAPWRAWCSDWAVAAPALRARNAPETTGAAAGSCLSGGAEGIWLASAHGTVDDAIGGLLFPPGHGAAGAPLAGALARAVVQAAGADLLRAMARIGEPSPMPHAGPVRPPVDAFKPGSGAVLVEAAGADRESVSISILLSGPLVVTRFPLGASGATGMTAAAGALSPIRQAVDAQAIRLRVELDAISLELGSLQTLREGDVLPLEHRLDQPLHVRDVAQADSNAPAVCAALLGRRNGRRAVELTTPSPLNPGISP